MTHQPTEHEVETFTGKYVDIANPKSATIDLESIAHGLSLTCRYGGQCSRFYSVAEHAVHVSRRLADQGHDLRTQFAGLHHDDAEAFLQDIPRPMKRLLNPQYAELTHKMDAAVAVAIGAHVPASMFHDEHVMNADNWMLFVEAKQLLPSQGVNWTGSGLNWGTEDEALWASAQDAPVRLGDNPHIAKALYLTQHRVLVNKIKEGY